MKGGVLIIGSLYWDIHQGKHLKARKDWRNKRLKFDQRIHVCAPIRYGRQSGKGVFTMVFSNAVQASGDWGTAYIASFKNEINGFRGLYNQAKFLSRAEGAYDTHLVKRADGVIWCVIGILFNPKLDPKRKKELLDQYHQKLNEEHLGEEYRSFCIPPEPSILTSQGEIMINWPIVTNEKNKRALSGLDFILATCPKPNLASYPEARVMKEALGRDERNYFYNNISNGITTYQDREILKP